VEEPGQPQCLRFQRPSLPDGRRIERYLELSRRARWFSNAGPCWRLLRDRLSERVGAYCVPVASGTLGLMAAIASVRTDQGTTVAAMPSFTFPATAQAALWAGLTPELLDIDERGWHLDPAQLERRLRSDGGSVALALAVSTFGTPPAAETREHWAAACRQAGVPLVIDSAAAFGAVTDDGIPVGAQGDVEIVSFHATKPFAVGEGGAVFTQSRELLERIESTINFGFRRDHSMAFALGLNAKMSELHAATALAVLDEFDSILGARRRAADTIRAQAAPGVQWQAGCAGSTWQFVPVAFASAQKREGVRAGCAGQLEVRTYYEPLHTTAAFGQLPATSDGLAVTEDLYPRILCLPMANDLSAGELSQIAATLEREPEGGAVGSHAAAVRQF
jgi:dTDP-4-amino-4,6-dideoxygalactose transaminase